MPLSIAIHAIVVTVLTFVPILWFTPPAPTTRDYVRALLYDPPPPPPPPLPLGPAQSSRPESQKKTPEESRPTPAFTAPVEAPPETRPDEPEPLDAGTISGGSPTGSELGVPEGMEGGVVGGVVGGVPGGVIGGVIGGTGDIPVPVMNYDRAPRLIRQIKPDYPQEAFVKKVEGVVVVEILIDDNGRVVRARVIRSIPLLDDAALAATRRWTFLPAIKDGRPVATVALAPVTFHLY